MFNVKRGGTDQGAIHADRGDGTMHDMIDLIRLKREHFTKSTPDLILKGHGFESCCTVYAVVDMRGTDHNWIEVVVTELSGLTGRVVGVTKDSAVRVPFTHCRAVGCDGFFKGDQLTMSEHSGMFDFHAFADSDFEGLIAEHMGSVGAEG